MANKYKKIFKSNLLSIREELGYTQKQMAKKLKVDEKTIRNYEYFETNFPLESAIFLSKTYGYTLDWIYCNFPTQKYVSNEENKKHLIDKIDSTSSDSQAEFNDTYNSYMITLSREADDDFSAGVYHYVYRGGKTDHDRLLGLLVHTG